MGFLISQSRRSSGFNKLAALFGVAMIFQVQSVLSAEDHHGSTDRHMVGVFLGAEDDAQESEWTYGFEYEYRFTPELGGGVLYEKVEDAHEGDGVSVVLALLSMHPHAGWRFVLGAGREEIHGSHGHTENLFRFGVGYDFHLGGFGIEPTFNIDRSERNSKYIYGVLINRKF